MNIDGLSTAFHILAGVGSNRQFEISNGSASIVTIGLLLFLMWYMAREWVRLEVRPRQLFNLPLGMQVAIAIFIADFGNLLVRAPVWYLRAHGLEPNTNVSWLVLIGTVIFVLGTLCKIRIFSRNYLGHAPWIVTGCVLGVFLGYRIAA